MSRPDSPKPPTKRVRKATHGVFWPVQRAAWAFEERVVWTGADAARSAAADARWPFERLAWAIQRRLVWPLQDLFGGRSRPLRTVLSLALVAAAAAAGVAGAKLGTPGSDGGGGGTPLLRAADPVTAVPTPAPEVASTPELKGAPPSFEAASASTGDDAAAARAADAAPATDTAGAAAATADSGPAPVQVNVVTEEVPRAALATSRRFAEAFVVYEIGQADPEVRTVFRETATIDLVRALAQRPPRQPALGDAPRAEVLNVVAGPRYGRSASVSVSLLRLGETSELRLSLERVEAGWRVSDVRG